MKKIFFILLAPVFFFACKKECGTEIESEIVGKWELERYSGFDASYTLPPDNGRVIIFDNNRKFQRKRSDTLEFSGTYSLDKKNDCFSRESNDILTTNEYPGQSFDYIKIGDGKLELHTPNCLSDGRMAVYRKVN